ncbi:MAG: DUF934 domain-containing protein [Ectothiorhodospiraceae bacterium]|nr:DUF934 domain-containing protein [Ectothiorhodospiraceae bacterium]MCH8506742.1 DUF934 domain-containing protein [Ectothiorhodospiraceae bacterium]
MTRLIKRREPVRDDPWQLVDEEQTLPQGDVVVPVARYLEERDALHARGGRVGVRVDGTVLAEDLADHLDDLALIAIEFPAFTDGRGYSLARQLRLRYAYSGELRAVGNVLRDQISYLERVGFDSMLLDEQSDLEDALKGFTEFSGYYQNVALEHSPLHLRRRTAAG